MSVKTLTTLINQPLFSIGDTQTTLGSLFLVIVVVVITFVMAGWAGKVVRSLGDRRQGQGTSRVYLIAGQVIVWAIGLEIVLQIIGVQLTTLFAAGGGLAIGAGFAAKNVVENFISGSILRAEKIIRPDDLIIANDEWLTVHKIGPRTVHASTFDGAEVVIPNTVIAQSTIQNLTRKNLLYRISLKVGVAYESDLALVRKTLEETVDQLEWRSKGSDPMVWLSEFGDSSVVYTVKLWIDDANNSAGKRSDLHEAIWWALKDADITIAYRQLDVHIDADSPPQTDRLIESKKDS